MDMNHDWTIFQEYYDIHAGNHLATCNKCKMRAVTIEGQVFDDLETGEPLLEVCYA